MCVFRSYFVQYEQKQTPLPTKTRTTNGSWQGLTGKKGWLDTVSKERQSKKTLSGFFASKGCQACQGRFPGGGRSGRDGPDQSQIRQTRDPEEMWGPAEERTSGSTARAKGSHRVKPKTSTGMEATDVDPAGDPSLELLPHKLPARTFQRPKGTVPTTAPTAVALRS